MGNLLHTALEFFIREFTLEKDLMSTLIVGKLFKNCHLDSNSKIFQQRIINRKLTGEKPDTRGLKVETLKRLIYFCIL